MKFKNKLVLTRILYLLILPRINYIIVPSRKLETIFKSKFNLITIKVDNFIDLSVFKPKSSFLLSEIRNFVYFGRINKEKGLFELVEVFIQNNTENIELYLIGKGKDVDLINKKINGMKNIHLIEFMKPKELAKFLTKMDFFVLPSYSEQFPVSLIEAYSVGLPSIVTNVGENGRIVAEAKVGYLIPAKNYNALKSAILMLTDMNQKDYQELSQMASQYALRFDGDNFIKLILRRIYPNTQFFSNSSMTN